jgi:hypothetical protein
LNLFQRAWKDLHHPDKANNDSDIIFTLSSAYVDLETKLGLKSTGKAAISIKNIDGRSFSEAVEEISKLLDIFKNEFNLNYYTRRDSYGYLWIVLQDVKIEDILACMSAIGDSVDDKGFSNQLLAAVFEFSDGVSKHYLIYNYKRNKFYPFVPAMGEKTVRSDEQMKIMSVMMDQIPIEKDMALWYPLWDLPF